jgi:hypothetical protein
MKGITLASMAFGIFANVCSAQNAPATAAPPQNNTAPSASADTPLDRAKAEVASLPGESMGATLQVIADLKRGDGTKAVADWLDPVKGEKPSMVSTVVGPLGSLFDTPVNGQMTATAPLVAGAATGADLSLALPAANLLAREQGMVGGLAAVHLKNSHAERGLSDFMDANLGPKQGQQVINELRNLDTANKTIAGASAFGPAGAATASAAGAKKAQLEAQLSGQFDQAITNSTQIIGTDIKK